MKVIDSDQTLRAYCPKHLPVSRNSRLSSPFADQQAEARAALDMDDDLDSSYSGTPMAPRIMPNARGAVTTKSARAHAKSYRPGPPIVPHMIVESLLKYTMKINIRKREQFVERLCRYWSLKREARRGAPLLKRLHLEASLKVRL
jgi:NuA3 HAT complex component NTO1